MAGQGRPHRLAGALLMLLQLIGVARGENAADNLRQDAQLADVCFVDLQHGWAVGDRGAIWHTSDGGAHWHLQLSGVDCRLQSVQFIDTRHGWAAGGWTQPYTHASTGVLLSTRDGGQTWSLEKQVLLPAVRQIKFFDAARGWAMTEANGLFPAGLFTTEDGGRSWSALPAAAGQCWLSGDFADPVTGAVVGRQGAMGVVRRRGVEPSISNESGLRALRRMKLISPRHGWLVGDGGLVLRTEDTGHSWQTPAAELPAGFREHFDFYALEAKGNYCWIAGSPGTRVLYSSDGGTSWKIQSTGQTLPIRALAFADERHGWAVGDLGLILATRDGGQSWQRQRAGGARAALVGLFSEPQQVPIEAFARLSADEGYLGVVEVLNRQDIDSHSADMAEAPVRVHEAIVRAGGSAADSAWRFPTRHAGLNLAAEQLIDDWNRVNDGRGLELMEAHLVAKIRQWRPEIVLTSSANVKDGDPRGRLMNQLVLRAVERAADATRYPEQIAVAGLDPWRVQKVYATLPNGELGTTTLNTAQIATRLGQSYADLAAPARGLLTTHYAPVAPALGFRLLVNQIAQEAGQRDFFSGIPLSPGSDARRRLSEPSDVNLEALRRSALARRNIQAIFTQAESKEMDDARWLGEIAGLTRGMESNHAAEVLFHLAQRYYRNGRWEAAAETFDLLVTQHPEHPLTSAALVWLIQYYSSGEAAWRVRQGGQIAVQLVNAEKPALRPESQATPDSVLRAGGLTPAAAVRQGAKLLAEQQGSENRFSRAAAYGRHLEQTHPSLFAEPTIRFPLAIAHRNQGFPRQAERFYLGFRRTRQQDAWWACAEGEQWMTAGEGQPPKSIWPCRQAAVKPHLDGQLDEAMWREAQPIELHSPQRDDAEWNAVAMLCRDAEFLYFAVSCVQAPGAQYPENDAPRPRDADLAAHDRVELCLDVDRDWTTYYRLVIDHRGWTAESCWHDKTWNPQWYVASRTGDGVWTAEAAIPLSELTNQLPESRYIWAAGVQRIVPGVGIQSWTLPASADVAGEAFGYLIFEP